MAVDADNPPDSFLGLFKSRPPQFARMDLPASAEPRSCTGACLLPLCHSLETYEAFASRAAAAACARNPSAVFPTFRQPAAMAPTLQTAAAARPHRSRKRKVLTDDMQAPPITLQNPANFTALSVYDLNSAQVLPTSSPTSNNNRVSTGLRLASFDEDGSTVTSSRPDTGSSGVNDELTAQLLHHQTELQQLVMMHAEQLKNALKECSGMHSQALLTTVEDEMSRRLQEKDAELGRIKRQCSELEDRIKHLTLETHVWQTKARNCEGMVTVLRGNLQQAVMHQSREQLKLEGCGDTDADDAASANIDENYDAQQTRARLLMERKPVLSRACKKCRAKEVTILLLPCMHLCLCQDCKQDVESCPLCATPRSAFVEVYLS